MGVLQKLSESPLVRGAVVAGSIGALELAVQGCGPSEEELKMREVRTKLEEIGAFLTSGIRKMGSVCQTLMENDPSKGGIRWSRLVRTSGGKREIEVARVSACEDNCKGFSTCDDCEWGGSAGPIDRFKKCSYYGGGVHGWGNPAFTSLSLRAELGRWVGSVESLTAKSVIAYDTAIMLHRGDARSVWVDQPWTPLFGGREHAAKCILDDGGADVSETDDEETVAKCGRVIEEARDSLYKIAGMGVTGRAMRSEHITYDDPDAPEEELLLPESRLYEKGVDDLEFYRQGLAPRYRL